MPVISINDPDSPYHGKRINFPDTMLPADIEAAIQENIYGRRKAPVREIPFKGEIGEAAAISTPPGGFIETLLDRPERPSLIERAGRAVSDIGPKVDPISVPGLRAQPGEMFKGLP